MKKVVLNHLVIAVIAMSAAFTSCGDGGSKSLSGTYVGSVHGVKTSIIFSGNKIKLVGEGKNEMLEGVYELVEEYKEDNFSRGNLSITSREGKNEMTYVLEGKGKILTFNGECFIKDGTKSSGKHLSGVYDDSYNNSISFSGNKFEFGYGIAGTYELFVTEDKRDGFSSGVISLTYDENGKIMNSMQRYVLEGNEFKFRGNTYIKK